jgi:hypothetical protein
MKPVTKSRRSPATRTGAGNRTNGVLLTPVPEPTLGLGAIVSLAAMTRRAARRQPWTLNPEP